MEDFNISNNNDFGESDAGEAKSDLELNISVSAICNRDEEKLAYVTFSDGKRDAEGEIPACKITKNNGFSDEEVVGLELYMKSDLDRLKKMAAGINIFDAFLK